MRREIRDGALASHSSEQPRAPLKKSWLALAWWQRALWACLPIALLWGCIFWAIQIP